MTDSIVDTEHFPDKARKMLLLGTLIRRVQRHALTAQDGVLNIALEAMTLAHYLCRTCLLPIWPKVLTVLVFVYSQQASCPYGSASTYTRQ